MSKRIVIALGGNALGSNLEEQMKAVKNTAVAIADLIEEGNEIVIAHGNGPQVGMIQNAITISFPLYAEGDQAGIDALEKELLAQNAEHKDWCCTEELMSTTKDGKALYLHCLPADINGVSCKDGEVEASVFDRYRDPLYKEASYKPYIIAAMILLAKQKDITGTLEALADKATPRHFGE